MMRSIRRPPSSMKMRSDCVPAASLVSFPGSSEKADDEVGAPDACDWTVPTSITESNHGRAPRVRSGPGNPAHRLQ